MRTHVFREYLCEKENFCKTGFACFYGAQVEFFDKKCHCLFKALWCKIILKKSWILKSIPRRIGLSLVCLSMAMPFQEKSNQNLYECTNNTVLYMYILYILKSVGSKGLQFELSPFENYQSQNSHSFVSIILAKSTIYTFFVSRPSATISAEPKNCLLEYCIVLIFCECSSLSRRKRWQYLSNSAPLFFVNPLPPPLIIEI